jgi:hypothetical protein
MRHRLLIAARSIMFGWATLFAVTYLVERPLIVWTAPLLGASWLPTEQLALACAGLVGTGWIIGRWNRFDVLIFAVTLAVWSFGLVPINLSWLFRLLMDSFESSRYLESFFTSLAIHVFLFGSLIIGANLSRTREPVDLGIK